jgi:hypothetical protein
LAFAQDDNADCGDENQDADYLKRQIVVAKQEQSNIANIIGLGRTQRRKRLFRHLSPADDSKNLDKKRQGDDQTTSESNPIYCPPFFGAQIEKHDDEEKQYHYCTGIDQDLNDPDKKCVQGHEQSGQAKEANNKTQRAGNGVAIDDDERTEDEHYAREGPEKERRHR